MDVEAAVATLQPLPGQPWQQVTAVVAVGGQEVVLDLELVENAAKIVFQVNF